MNFLIQAAPFLPLVIAARLRGIERKAIARLTDAGANTAERAIQLEPGGRLQQFVYYRLKRAGALQNAAADRYYFDQAGYDALRGSRRTRALAVIALLLIGLAVGYYRGVFA
jgi:hypothetical protein